MEVQHVPQLKNHGASAEPVALVADGDRNLKAGTSPVRKLLSGLACLILVALVCTATLSTLFWVGDNILHLAPFLQKRESLANEQNELSILVHWLYVEVVFVLTATAVAARLPKEIIEGRLFLQTFVMRLMYCCLVSVLILAYGSLNKVVPETRFEMIGQYLNPFNSMGPIAVALILGALIFRKRGLPCWSSDVGMPVFVVIVAIGLIISLGYLVLGLLLAYQLNGQVFWTI